MFNLLLIHTIFLLTILENLDDTGKVVETFEKMKAKGIIPNTAACNASLYSLAEMGRLREAKKHSMGLERMV